MKLLLIVFFSFSTIINATFSDHTVPTGEWEMKSKTAVGWKMSTVKISKKNSTFLGKNSNNEKFNILIDGKKISWRSIQKMKSGNINIKSVGTIQSSGKEIKGYSIIQNGPMKGHKWTWTLTKK